MFKKMFFNSVLKLKAFSAYAPKRGEKLKRIHNLKCFDRSQTINLNAIEKANLDVDLIVERIFFRSLKPVCTSSFKQS